MAEQHPFKWRHFQADIILLRVRWYLRYALSYRDLEEMMAERGLHLDHTTIFRWVQRYAPELETAADHISRPQRTLGGSMRHISKSKRSGFISTGRLIHWGIPWSSC